MQSFELPGASNFRGLSRFEFFSSVLSVKSVVDFTSVLQDPALAEIFYLQFSPLCNPTGFEENPRHSRRGRDLNREFWKSSPEAEVQLLERELHSRHFSGIIQLHADDTSDGIYGFVR